MNKKENSTELKRRVMTCKGKLQEIGVKSALHYFCLKYPIYKDEKKKDNISERLRNLWYCKISDEQFVNDLEAFTVFKEVDLS